MNSILKLQEESSNDSNPCNISPEEYFDSNIDLSSKDIGRPKETNAKVQKFKVIKIMLSFIIILYYEPFHIFNFLCRLHYG